MITRNNPEQAQCIADAYYSDTGLTDQGYAEIRAKVSEFESYHPTSVLVVMVENQCGAFN